MPEKFLLYEQKFKPKDILNYLPAPFKKKLSAQEKKYIVQAFYAVVCAYRKKYEEKYLDRMIF